ncbi:MAG: type III PLP-dependent enzyme [Candidatus Sedimenticola endophacoides]
MSGRTIRIGGSEQEHARYQALVAQHGSPLLILDRAELLRRYRLLQDQLPDADIYYAIKAFAHPAVLETLGRAGAHFDVASAGEIGLLRELKISGRRTIHTHPIKKDADIRAALRGGSTTFVVDNIDELRKLIPYKQRIGLLLRVSFRSDTAKVDLSRKFGCTPEQVPELVHQAATLGVHVRGLSFHVGSQSLSPATHAEAIRRCAELIRETEEQEGRPLDVLDIGGGFPVDYAMSGCDTDAYFRPIREALGSLPEHISVIAEPGRFLIAPAVTGICTVTGKARRGDYLWYYLDDGIYGSYSGQLFDHTRYPLQIFRDQGERRQSILAGPTCDSIDIIAEDVELPELEDGDLLIGHMMGAYTQATSTHFNSLEGAKVIVI